MTTGLSWCWAKVLDHHHHHHHFDCSRPLTGAPRACSDGQRSRRHGTHARMHTVACARRLRGASRGPHSRALELRCDEAGSCMERGEGASQPAGEKASPTAAVCASVVLSSIPPCSSSPISHLTLPFSRLVSSHLVSSRLVSPRLGVASCHPMSCALTYCSYSTHRTGSASIPPNTMAGRQARFFRSGPCVIEAPNSLHYAGARPCPLAWTEPNYPRHSLY